MLPGIKDKHILFITTKNQDYIRIVQEIRLIKEQAKSCRIIASSSKYYLFRLTKVFAALLATSAAKYDTVLIGFAPQLILPLFSWKFRSKYIIIDFFISLYDTLCLDRQKFRPNGPAGRFLHYIDAFTIAHADSILCDTYTHGQYFIDEFQACPAKLHPLYLQADLSLYHPAVTQKPPALQSKCVVLYFGSILPLQGADIVLQAISYLKDEKDLFFFFIGPVKNKKIHALCPHSSNIEYIDWISQKELAAYIGQSDLCLAGHFSGTIAKATRTIPGKAYIYQAMQKPMILGDNPANRELFSEDDHTIFVKMGDARGLAEAILTFAVRQKLS